MSLTSLSMSSSLRNARLQKIIDALDAGPGPGTIKLYTTPLPSTTGAAITSQTLLGTLTLSDPSGTISGGVLTFSTISDDTSADADGVIAWGRMQDSTGAFVLDATAGTSGTVFIFNTTTVVTGGVIRMVSASITEGNP